MTIGQLNLPARYAAGEHFKKSYGAAHFATDRLDRMTDAEGRIKPGTNHEDTKQLCKVLSESLCAARALDNILAGNPPPKIGG